jgi:hypothetical protein
VGRHLLALESSAPLSGAGAALAGRAGREFLRGGAFPASTPWRPAGAAPGPSRRPRPPPRQPRCPGALKDNCRAVLVGGRTYGKGLIQSVYELSDTSGLIITVGKYLTPGGVDIDRFGIEPNFKSAPGRGRVEAELDACRVSRGGAGAGAGARGPQELLQTGEGRGGARSSAP